MVLTLLLAKAWALPAVANNLLGMWKTWDVAAAFKTG
jgi:hypothetical protein